MLFRKGFNTYREYHSGYANGLIPTICAVHQESFKSETVNMNISEGRIIQPKFNEVERNSLRIVSSLGADT